MIKKHEDLSVLAMNNRNIINDWNLFGLLLVTIIADENYFLVTSNQYRWRQFCLASIHVPMNYRIYTFE